MKAKTQPTAYYQMFESVIQSEVESAVSAGDLDRAARIEIAARFFIDQKFRQQLTENVFSSVTSLK